jgi:hypothetical protein
MSLPHTPHSTDRGNSQILCSIPSSQSDCAAWSFMDATSVQYQPMQPVLPDPFAYYKAFLNTDASPSGSTNRLEQEDDGYTCNTGTIGLQDFHHIGTQQHAKARPIPYHLAVRLANRPDGGAPLATIIEQGSYSTLNSRGSLLSVGLHPSARVAENHFPRRASYRVSRSLEDTTLYRIQEDAPQEQYTPAVVQAHAHPQDRGRSPSKFEAASPMKTSFAKLPQFPRSQISDADHEVNRRRSKGFLRGILQNVRAAARTRSRSSSSTHMAVVETRADWQGSSDNSPLSELQERDHLNREECSANCKASDLTQGPHTCAASTPMAGSRTRNRKISVPDLQLSAPTSSYPSLHESSLPIFEQTSNSESVHDLLQPATVVRSLGLPSSVCLVFPEPRDVAYVGVATRSPTLSTEHRDGTSAQNTFDGVSVPKHSASSLPKHDHARETSRNASFSSTMSTSYSGTVLGVDLDLHQDNPRSVHQSISPLPV